MKIRHGFLTMAMAAALAVVWPGGARAGELIKVRFSHFPAFHTMAVYVAHQKDFFRDEGLDVEMFEASSGALQPIQLVTGDVDIASTELQNVVRLQHEGKKAIYVFDLVRRMSMDFVVQNDVLARIGVRPADPLDKKLQALRGLKIGYTSPNSPSDVYSRYYLQKAGLVPGRDAEMVAIGSPPSLVAALKTKRIDAFQLTAPTSTLVEKEGFGTALIRGSAGEVKELDNYPYFGVIVMESYAAQHPDVLRRFIRATRRGVASMRSDLDGTVRALYQALGADLDAISDESPAKRFWERLGNMPERDLWAAHHRQKTALAIFARGRLLRQFARHGEAPETLEALSTALDPDVLTIGFARRFATYKRAALLFSQEERLARLLWDGDRPVQVVFAGKAHPADRPGQRVIQDIFERTRSPLLRGRVYFLEDYDMRIARHLVQGVDVWLNNPRRPLEASGTSGMKAAANGAVNCSVLDGWWDEGWTGTNGWAIGGRETLADEGAQDWADAEDLYRLLEQEIVPRWYERDDDGLPRAWLALMRASMATTVWRFSTTRMLEEYVERLYLPAALAGASGEAPPPVLAAERS